MMRTFSPHPMPMEPMITIALRAARDAARHIVRAYDRPDLIKIREKGPNDFVTNVDQEAEQIIAESLKKTFPKHRVTGEESGDLSSVDDSEHQWVIDPIDGTANFSRQIPHFCVSMACLHRGKLLHGIIVNPITEEEFVATRGKGAQLNGKKIRVSSGEKLEGALFASAGRYSESSFHGHAQVVQALVNAGANYREPGSAALELAAVAAGRLDGVWMHGLNLWDIAAGCLLIQEAGGLIGDFKGGLDHLTSGNLVAANPKIFKSLGTLARQHLGK
ncbi:MAG: inositol monophosphatase family protein [Pseudomonadales bacterium]